MSEIFQLQLRQQLDVYEGDLVEDAQKLIKKYKIYKKECEMEENQIRNVLNVAANTKSVEVIKAFIQYQIGRSKENVKWASKSEENMICFGDALICELEQLRSGNEKVNASKIAPEVGAMNDLQKHNEIWWRLAILYLGYLNWYFIYRKRKAEEKQ
ncbi:TPA: hypothetical protein EYP66_24350 [Candidatus Poribacteria bacterium]|nr:hypothetical protein [Candidatus Poribacteria bacterium]